MASPQNIDKNNVESISNLTSLQEGMLFHYTKNSEKDSYLIRLFLNVKGDFSYNVFCETWNKLSLQNEVLRTIFRWEGLKTPVQIVLKQKQLPCEYIDVSHQEIAFEDAKEYISEFHSNNDINLTDNPFYLSVYKINRNEFTIEIKYHHILYDGWSNGIILSEFFEVYHSILNNKPVTFKPKVRFNEYIKEINKVQKKDINSFWQNHLLDYSLIPAFSDKIEESAELPIFCDINYSLSNDLNAKINDYSAKNHVSVASILYTSWGILLQKITNSNDVLFGTTISGRNVQIKHIENTVGLFINTIPLRIINLGNDTIQNTINNVNKHLIDREIYTNCSLAELKRISSVGQNEDLFNSLVIIENYPINFDEIKKMEQFEVKSYEMAEHTHYDLTLTIKLFDKPELIINYNNALYSKNLIVKLQSQLVRILETIVNKPTIEIVDIKLITSDEKNKISNQFNNTYLEYDRHLTIDQAFERQAQLNLDKEIITCNNKSITYKEFLQQSNSLANNLIDNSIVPGNLVGIMMGRSSEMLVAILSVLKAGATYVPIDPKFPDDRITHMIEDSKLKLIITDNQNRAKVEQLQGYFGIIDFAEIDNSRTEFCAKIQKSKKATDAAYVIYTSGSTGKPKGVVISHSNVLNFIEGITSSIQFNQNDKILAVTTVSFDIFVLETLLPLIKGTKIVIATDEETVEPELLCNLIKKHNIGLLQFTPSRLKLLLSYDEFLHSFTNVKILMLGGEALPENLFSELKQKFNGLIYNLYGPTETTVWSTLKELTNEQKVTIGKPIANTKIFILGGNNEIQPIGFSGELCIGGEGVGLGYFNNEALTNEKFIIDKNLDANPIYRTGDIAKWLEDGNIYFFGRKDNQVKIRGYRIETGDIESILSEYKGISDCVVIAINDNNDTAYLCAYYVSDEQISTNSLAEYLLDKLPEYMIPSYFMAIDKVPLTPNGKINRKALPSPQLISVNDYVAPTNNTEHLLVSIWSEILGIDKNAVSIHADFFKLGGHSLKVTKLISQIYKHANCKLSVSNVFNNATVYKIASLINNSKKEKLSTVSKAEIKTKYPLSNSQKRLFVLQQLDRDATFYNMPGLFKVNKKIDRKKLEETLTLLVKRHESLRSNIILDEGKPLLMINDSNKLIIETYTAPPLQEYQMVEKVDEIFSEFIKPFELEKNLLFRAGIIETEGEILYVMIDMHHIISDGTSVDLLYKEFIDLYQQKELSKLTYQYQDYVKWIGDRKNNETYLKQKKYWLNIFQQDISPLQLPTDFERPSIQSFKGDSCEIKISDELYNGLIKLSENLKISPFVCLLGCINILLSKLSNSDDIAVGFTQAGREKEEWQNIVGMFVNTLPLRNYLSNDSTFETFISKVKDNFLKALENQEVRLEDIIENININRDPSRNPIFDVLINYQETEMVNTDGSQVLIEKVYQLRKISKFDLTFDCLKRNDSIEIRLEYATSLFAVETIKRIANSLSNIFKCIADNPSIQLSNINILGKEEINTLLNKFNSTNFLFNRNLAITQIFESQVNKYAINIALSYKNNILTYSELDSKSNQFAHFLKDKDIKRGDVIGVIGERSIELIITIFGILKAGAVYLPLDKAFPVKRVNYILDNCKAKLIISPIDNVIINNVSVETIFYDQSKYNTYNNKQVNEKCEDNDLAYIIYTSGSTGTPKGVMVEHRQAVNLLYSLNKMYPLYNEDSFLLKTPCVFDVSISELFGWFMNGGKLSILPSEKEKDAYEIIHSIHENKITHINFVPSLFNVFVDILEPKDYEKLISLKYIFLAGEAINPNAIQKFNQIPHSISLENIYGPTEATVYSTNYSLNSWGKKSEIPIGKPLYNTQAYIINANNQLCGIGIIGELCLSGANLARGYFNNEEITKEKFIDHPFINGCKMYKTGDLAKWLPDGNIEFKGRIDDQVKIRGYRIELGEIENVINKINKIKQVVAIPIETGEKGFTICAYYIADEAIAPSVIKNIIVTELPEYMIPNHFIQLDNMPLTVNNKIDKKALPIPVFNNQFEIIQPATQVEKQLHEIWADLLNIDKESFGINSNFFELGGHSLNGTLLLYKIEKKLGRLLPLSILFRYPELSNLAKYINSQSISQAPQKTMKSDKRDFYPLSPFQKGMFILQEQNANSTVYNMPSRFEISGNLDLNKLKTIINKIIERHDILRTSFGFRNNEPIQTVIEDVKIEINVINNEITKYKNVPEAFVKPFNLSLPPLLRVHLLKINDHHHSLMIDFHHIVFDGISANIFIKDFIAFYNEKSIERLKIQYADYAIWSNENKFLEHQKYWLNEFKSGIPDLDLKTDFNRPEIKTFEGNVINFSCSREIIEKLKLIARNENSTMNIVLLSAYIIFLSKLSSKEDIVVGIPVSCRQSTELQDLIGMFVNTITIKCNTKQNKKLSDFIAEVKQKLLSGLQYQDYPFDKLVDNLKIKKRNNKNPIFDVAFSYEKKNDIEKEVLDGISMKALPYENSVSRFDLTLFAIERDENIEFSFEYSTELFSKESMLLMEERFISLLNNLVNSNKSEIGAIDFITNKEKVLKEAIEEVDFDF